MSQTSQTQSAQIVSAEATSVEKIVPTNTQDSTKDAGRVRVGAGMLRF